MKISITGVGSVSSCGAGVDEVRRNLAAGASSFSRMSHEDGYHRPGAATAVGTVDDDTLRPWLQPAKARRMGRPSKLAVAAAAMAMADAGLEGFAEDEQDDIAVVTATSFGPAIFTERLLKQVFQEEPTAASPALFTESVANAPAAQIALRYRARGPNITVTQREAGPYLALHRAARLLRARKARRVLVAAVDEVSPVLHAALDRFGVLTRSEPPLPRPYDRRRDGFVLAEGATALLLEREDDALGERDYGRVVVGGGAFDPRARPTGFGPDGSILAGAIEASLQRAGLAMEAFDAVVGGASGSRHGDLAEGRVLSRLLSRDVHVVTPKAVAGECCAVALAGAVLTAASDRPAVAAGFVETDPDVGVVPYTGGEWSVPRRVFSLAVAAGGSCSWIGIERRS